MTSTQKPQQTLRRIADSPDKQPDLIIEAAICPSMQKRRQGNVSGTGEDHARARWLKALISRTQLTRLQLEHGFSHQDPAIG